MALIIPTEEQLSTQAHRCTAKQFGQRCATVAQFRIGCPSRCGWDPWLVCHEHRELACRSVRGHCGARGCHRRKINQHGSSTDKSHLHADKSHLHTDSSEVNGSPIDLPIEIM